MSMSNEAKEGSWSNLLVELLDLIMRRLSLVDQLSFRAVCKSWCSLNNVRPPDQRPWLLVFSDDMDEYSWRSCNVINPSTKTSYAIDMSSIRKKNEKLHNAYPTQVHQSKYGWLMISSYHHRKLFCNYSRSLYLFTPFRKHNNLIDLPTMNRSKSFKFATFSSDPSRKDCLFLTVKPVYKNNSLSIKTCHHGDKSWRTITRNFTECDLSIGMIVAWLYSEGILYYADRKGRVGAFDITTSRHTRGSSSDHVLLPKIPNLPHSVQNGSCSYSVDMVELDGLLYYFFQRSSYQKLYRIDVRLDRSLMTWKEIVHQYCMPSRLSRTIPNITLLLGDAGYRSVLKYSEDGHIEMMYDCSRTQLCDNSPFRICFQTFCSSRVHYRIDHPLACISN